jgi:hypothetical protein
MALKRLFLCTQMGKQIYDKLAVFAIGAQRNRITIHVLWWKVKPIY